MSQQQISWFSCVLVNLVSYMLIQWFLYGPAGKINILKENTVIIEFEYGRLPKSVGSINHWRALKYGTAFCGWPPTHPTSMRWVVAVFPVLVAGMWKALIHFMEGHQCGLPLSTKIRCYVGWFCISHQDVWEFVTNDPKEKQVMIFFTLSWRWLPVTKF